MPTLEELLKSKDRSILDKIQEVVESSTAKRLSESAPPMTSAQINALNQYPELLEKVDFSKSRSPEIPTMSSITEPSVKDVLRSESKMATEKLQKIDEIAKPNKVSEIAKKLESLPDEELSKFGKLGEYIKQSRLAGVGGAALGAAAMTSMIPEAQQASEEALNSPSLIGKMGGALKTTGKSAEMASIPVAVANPLVGGATALAGMGTSAIGEGLSALEASRQSFQDPKNIQAIRELGAGMSNSGDNWKQYFDPSKFAQTDEEIEAPEPVDLPSTDQSFSDADSEVIEAPAPVDTSQLEQALLEKGFTNATVDQLAEAQKAANVNRLIANIGQGTSQIGSAIASLGAGSQVKPGDMKQFFDQADVPVEQYKQRVEMEKKDPKSQYSVGFRNFAKPLLQKLGINADLVENMSGDQLGTLVPQLRSMYNEKLEGEYRQRALQESAALRKEAREENKMLRTRMLDERLENQVNNRFDKNTKDEVARIQAADRVNALINAVENGVLVDSANIRNTLTNDVSILALPVGTRGTLADREKTAINTLSTKLKDILTFVTDNPQKTIPRKFIKQLKTETNLLKDKYVSALKQKTESLKKGTSNEQAKELLDGRLSEFIKEEQSKDVNKDVQDYANQYFKGNYQAAEAYLKSKGHIK